MKTYPLHELSSKEFENLVISICDKILGIGTLIFSDGPDGGRDGKFTGKANCFPSKTNPWNGKFIIQAKSTINPISSCSDTDFIPKILDKEIPKIKKLKSNGEIDIYLLFTNRKLSTGTHVKLINYLKKHTGLKFIEKNDFKSRNIALFGTSGGGEGKETEVMEIMLRDKYANVIGKYFCQGKFWFGNKDKPSNRDLYDAKRFAKNMIK